VGFVVGCTAYDPARMAAGDSIRVMVVDDASDVRFLVRVILGDHEDLEIVAEAATAQEALDAFDDAAPDVAIVDARMPMVDGYELSRELLIRRPGFPIALLTSVVDDIIEAEAAAAGVAAVASKADFDALPGIVRRLAGR
jgi:DNA-binding NarL/FixJ family response regulator